MFVRTSRNSFSGNDQKYEAAVKLFDERIKPMWSKQKGFHSLQRFKIVEGPYKDQEMIVMRFDSQDNFKKAIEAVKDEREATLKEIADTGVKIEEVMMLEEIT